MRNFGKILTRNFAEFRRNSAKKLFYFFQFRISRNSQIPISWPPYIYILCIEHLRILRGIRPGISCTAGEYSMKRAIRMAVLSCHSGSHLCCYNTIIVITQSASAQLWSACSKGTAETPTTPLQKQRDPQQETIRNLKDASNNKNACHSLDASNSSDTSNSARY
jgi:hypothetical protein